ncbi:hypothetical protein PGIGA_G00004680 [Pangasianodon gigas]|uniref:Uncharacterized protein n=1 Tax=Pangasianodon gigas TaxID=30993 RepID=A0ACC5W6C5_PANGG|nr:hypothetical protein [Pangasianodon gigas]
MGTPEEDKQPRPSDITVFGANCTLHGLSHIFLPGGVTIRRLLWASAFISSLSIFLYQVAGAVMEYYRYPHVTILDEMDSPVMYFPAITLCNYNSFRRSKMQRNDLFWMAGLLGVEQSDFDDFMAALGQPVDDSKFFPSKTFNMLEFVQRTSHSIEEMLLDCKYRGRDCGPENFTSMMDKDIEWTPIPQLLPFIINHNRNNINLFIHFHPLACFWEKAGGNSREEGENIPKFNNPTSGSNR